MLDGVCASGLNEAKLGKKYFGGLISTYSPAFRDSEFDDIIKCSQHVTFNSISQMNKYKKLCVNKNIDICLKNLNIKKNIKFISQIHSNKIVEINKKNINVLDTVEI